MSIKSKFSANEVKILNFGINKIITQVMIQTLAKMLKNKSREVPKFVLYLLVPSLLLFIVLLLFRPFLFRFLFFLLTLHSHSFSPTLSRPLLPSPPLSSFSFSPFLLISPLPVLPPPHSPNLAHSPLREPFAGDPWAQ